MPANLKDHFDRSFVFLLDKPEDFGPRRARTYHPRILRGDAKIRFGQRNFGIIQQCPEEWPMQIHVAKLGQTTGFCALKLMQCIAYTIPGGKQVPGLRLLSHCGGGSFKSQFKKADRSGAALALIVGDDELASGNIGIKYLREEKEQVTLELEGLAAFLADHLQDS